MEKTPFGMDFEESRYFPSASHEEALARTAYAIEQGHAISVVAGLPGVGKTFLLRMLTTRIRSSGGHPVLVETPMDDGDFRVRFAEQLGIPTWRSGDRQPTWNQIRESLRGLQLTERQTVLLMELSSDETSLPSLSRLTTWARGEFQGVLTVLIAGSPSLSAIFETADRFAMMRIELSAWSIAETSQFIRSRLAHRQENRLQFTESAMGTIADFAKGVPRDVLAVCDLVWNVARVDGLQEVDADVVLAAVREWANDPGFPAPVPVSWQPSRISPRQVSRQQAAAEEFAVH